MRHSYNPHKKKHLGLLLVRAAIRLSLIVQPVLLIGRAKILLLNSKPQLWCSNVFILSWYSGRVFLSPLFPLGPGHIYFLNQWSSKNLLSKGDKFMIPCWTNAHWIDSSGRSAPGEQHAKIHSWILQHPKQMTEKGTSLGRIYLEGIRKPSSNPGKALTCQEDF